MSLKPYMTNRSLIALVVGLALLLGAGTAIAQINTGTIYGDVTDDQGLPIPGVTVTITSPSLMGQQVHVTSGTGAYRGAQLPPGTYTVTMALSGFQTINNQEVELRAGRSIAVNATLSAASVEEVITVTGESPLVDVKNVQTMRTLDSELLENIPLGRNYSDLIVSIPGVVDSEYSFTPAQTVHGSSPRDNLFNIDGASLNDTTVGYISTELPIDMIEEVQVTTGGINAEYGMAQGGVFNFVTKSGGNEFHGTANTFYQGESTESDNMTPELSAQIPEGTSVVKNQEVGGTFGGPIARDKFWFFGNLRRLEVEQQEPFLPGQPFETTQTHSFVKLSGQLGGATSINGSLTTRRQGKYPGNVTGFSNADHPETWNDFKRSQNFFLFNATHLLNESTIIEAKASRVFKHFSHVYPNNPDFKVGWTDVGTGESFGGLTGGVGDTLARDMGQLHLTVTHYRETGNSTHDFKAGLYAEQSPFIRQYSYPNGEDVQQQLKNGVPYRVNLLVYPIHKQGTMMDRFAFFVQDQWTIGDNLTLNLGVRFTQTEGWFQQQSAGGGRWYPKDTLEETRDALNWDSVSPRFGLVWALGEEQRTSIKASYGRYYKPMLNQDMNYLRPRIGGSETFDWNDLNNDLVFQDGEQGIKRSSSRGATNTNQVDPNLKVPHNNSFHFALEHQITDDFMISAAAIVKKDGDIHETIDIGRPFSGYQEVGVTNPIDGSPISIYVLKPEYIGVGRIRYLTNPDIEGWGPLKRDYRALELVAQRRWRDGWQFSAAVNITSAKGNIGNSYGSTWGAHAVYDSPNSLVNSYGPLDLDAPLQIKLQGTYTLPFDIIASAYYLGLSGFPIKPPQNFPSDPNLGAYTLRYFKSEVPQMQVEGYVDVSGMQRGSERADFLNKIDVRLEKKFQLGGGKSLGIMADVFNLTNVARVTAVQSLRYDLKSRFLIPAKLQPPRIVRLGVRFEF